MQGLLRTFFTRFISFSLLFLILESVKKLKKEEEIAQYLYNFAFKN